MLTPEPPKYYLLFFFRRVENHLVYLHLIAFSICDSIAYFVVNVHNVWCPGKCCLLMWLMIFDKSFTLKYVIDWHMITCTHISNIKPSNMVYVSDFIFMLMSIWWLLPETIIIHYYQWHQFRKSWKLIFSFNDDENVCF